MKATLEQILGGEVEIPVEVKHYKILDKGRLLHQGFNEKGAGYDLCQEIYIRKDAFGRAFDGAWESSCDWIVEWEECGSVRDEGAVRDCSIPQPSPEQ